MATLENVDRISFVTDVLYVRDGRKLGAIRPDENGYYTIPLAVLGIPTDNHTYYDVDQFVNQITSPTSTLNKRLTDGKLYGEYGHPTISVLPEDKIIPRLLDIVEEKTSHHIRKLWTGDKLATGGVLIYGAIKPTGPYGTYLKDNFDDPCMNTSFSLRSIATGRQENGITRRKIKSLVTFDYVTGGGYNQAAKRFAPGVESMVDISLIDNKFRVTESAMESLSDTELNEIFGAKKVTIGNTAVTFIDKTSALQDEAGKYHSVFTKLMTTK